MSLPCHHSQLNKEPFAQAAASASPSFPVPSPMPFLACGARGAMVWRTGAPAPWATSLARAPQAHRLPGLSLHRLWQEASP